LLLVEARAETTAVSGVSSILQLCAILKEVSFFGSYDLIEGISLPPPIVVQDYRVLRCP
jgi:hypothetical protein